MATLLELVDRLDAALPQTQCTRCGYPDCHSYASAIATNHAEINQCPPGGADGILRLSEITGRPPVAMNKANGAEGPRLMAFVDESGCIGCTLCIKACPVDCIVGAPKRMHSVIEDDCTGCELCIPACPVDCIRLEVINPQLTGWAAWSEQQASEARAQYAARNARRARLNAHNDARLAAKAERTLSHLEEASRLTDPNALLRKQAVLEAAIAAARARNASTS